MRNYLKEPFPTLSHFLGLILSIVGLIVLLQSSGNDERKIVISAVYGASLILLYLASTLNHGVRCSPKLALRLEQFDYAAIFLLIAGTYTPICTLIIKGRLGWTILAIEWLLAVSGIVNIFYGKQRSKISHVAIFIMMGWLFLVALGPITSNVPLMLLSWLIGGASLYSLGSVVFIMESRSKWNGPMDGHNLWHLMVLSGSTCHFFVMSNLILIS